MSVEIGPELHCPKCGAVEEHPDGLHIVIRGFKVESGGHWWSQCLRCSGFYDASLNETPEKHDRDKGWFK